MTYKETLEFLFSQLPVYHRIGKAAYKADLLNTVAFDTRLGKPHRLFKTIHIAGTNGKGSVSHMMASVLQEAGIKTGLYTSPHLRDFRERIRVNGEMISEDDVVSFVEENIDFIESIKPSFFEMTVAMALSHFAKSRVEVAVIEVGMGGRLDSTNIITPLLSVITNIGHDHMDMLGNSIELIANEKAGIIKENVPVLIGEINPVTRNVFVSKARQMNAPIYFAEELFSCSLEEYFPGTDQRAYSIFSHDNINKVDNKTPLGGNCQARNLVTVYSAFSILENMIDITPQNISEGISRVISNTGLQGRWQVLRREPLTICDTGHNKEGLKYVVDQLAQIPKSDLHIIIGFVNDKDLHSVLPLFPVGARYYFTKALIPRAMNELILKNEAGKFGLKGEAYPDVKEALLAAEEHAEKSDVIFIGGSTFVVAEVV